MLPAAHAAHKCKNHKLQQYYFNLPTDMVIGGDRRHRYEAGGGGEEIRLYRARCKSIKSFK